LTSLTATVTYWPSATPDNETIISLPLNVGVPAVAVPSVTATDPLITAFVETEDDGVIGHPHPPRAARSSGYEAQSQREIECDPLDSRAPYAMLPCRTRAQELILPTALRTAKFVA
jgi:hypothetical protein